MTQINSRPNRFRLIRPVFAAALGLTALAAVAAPASAREWDHGRDGRAHEWRHADWRWHRPAFFGFAAPAPVYVPAPVYAPYGYAPAPVYAAPEASFNLVLPLNIR